MKPEISMFRKRLGGLLVALPLILGLGFVSYKYGPGSVGSAEKLATATKTEAPPAKGDEGQRESSQLLDLFGMREMALAKGRVNMTPVEYLNSLEELYRRRGYQKIEINDRPKKNRTMKGSATKPAASKFFQRADDNGMGSISAIGSDADYTTTQQSAEPFSFSILVTPAENGGAEWTAYRLEIDRDKLAQLANLDHGEFPGADPPGIPRLQGLDRIYAFASARGSIAIYKSQETETALTIRYLDEMPHHGWRFESDVSSNANKAARGVMCFTKAESFAMIWITTNKETGTANVTISSH